MQGDTIRQRADGRWEVVRHGTALATGTSPERLARRYDAVIERDSESQGTE